VTRAVTEVGVTRWSWQRPHLLGRLRVRSAVWRHRWRRRGRRKVLGGRRAVRRSHIAVRTPRLHRAVCGLSRNAAISNDYLDCSGRFTGVADWVAGM